MRSCACVAVEPADSVGDKTESSTWWTSVVSWKPSGVDDIGAENMPDCDQDMELLDGGSRWDKAEGGGVAVRKTLEESTVVADAGSPCCRISRDGFYGRHLVATRDVGAGEVVLQEAPLVTGPAPGSPPCCVSCYRPLRRPLEGDPKTTECPRGCGWPVCSERCARNPRHWPECRITRHNRGEKVSVEWGAPSRLLDSLIVLRCLSYRDSSPDVWAKLVGLESHCAKRKETGQYEQDRTEVARFLLEYFNLRDVFSEEEVLRMCGAIQINGYGVHLTDPAHCAVYDTLSFIEHHCVANCSKSWSTEGVLTVRAVADVPCAGHLAICYTNPLRGTQARRRHLAHELLACQCDRCADPSEMGTYYSAVRCTAAAVGNTCQGFLLPLDPLAEPSSAGAAVGSAGVSPWQCGTCDRTVRPDDVAAIIDHLQSALNGTDAGDATQLTALLDKCQQVLHTNHFLTTEIRIALAPLIGADVSELHDLTDAELRFKTVLCRDVLRLADVLFKGVNRVTGVMRYELHRSLMEDARRHAKRGDRHDEDVTARMTEARTLLVEATSILSFEPDVLPEGRVALRAIRSLEDLEAALKDVSIHSSSEQ